jgi:hypothetical protein
MLVILPLAVLVLAALTPVPARAQTTNCSGRTYRLIFANSFPTIAHLRATNLPVLTDG